MTVRISKRSTHSLAAWAAVACLALAAAAHGADDYVQDLAQNPLDGEFAATFPSGNGIPGNDYIAEFEIDVKPVGSGVDSDGDGFSDDLENDPRIDTDPDNASDTPLGGLLAEGNAVDLLIKTAKVKLNFRKTPRDSMTVTGVLDVGVDFDFTNRTVAVVAEGVTRTFDLDGKGRGVDGPATLKFTKPGKDGLAKFTFKTRKDDLQSELDPDTELVNADVPAPGADGFLDVVLLLIGDRLLVNDFMPITYKAKAGKSGSAKGKNATPSGPQPPAP